MRAAVQFKSPIILTGGNLQASTIRLTPAIQALERKLQILNRATKVREENEEDVLRGLIAKWTGAGQEVAYADDECVGMGPHVGSVDVQQVISKEGVFVVAWYGLDEVFLIGS